MARGIHWSYPACVTQKQLAFQNNGVSRRPYEVSYGARGKPMTCQGECCLVGRSVSLNLQIPCNTLFPASRALESGKRWANTPNDCLLPPAEPQALPA